MSREEVARILSVDMGQLDESVKKKISSLQTATQSIDSKTKFLLQFQQMMQEEMNNMKNNKTITAITTSANTIKEVVPSPRIGSQT